MNRHIDSDLKIQPVPLFKESLPSGFLPKNREAAKAKFRCLWFPGSVLAACFLQLESGSCGGEDVKCRVMTESPLGVGGKTMKHYEV